MIARLKIWWQLWQWRHQPGGWEVTLMSAPTDDTQPEAVWGVRWSQPCAGAHFHVDMSMERWAVAIAAAQELNWRKVKPWEYAPEQMRRLPQLTETRA